MYYFAYGSNMNHKQMLEERCPGSKFIKKIKLEGYKFLYDGKSGNWDNKAVGNIIPSESDKVWGGLFEINDDNLDALDCFEGYKGEGKNNAYDRVVLIVVDESDKKYDAVTYLRTGKAIGEPSEDYRAQVHKGARDCELDEGYIEKYLES